MAPAGPGRRGYLDWLRGLAVLIMIEAHILDSWTRFDDRGSRIYSAAMIVGGIGAPLFLFLAGLSVALSAASKFRRTSDTSRASRAVVFRGLQIFGLAFLFRLQACIVSWGPWWTLLKVDILNIMGPSIMAAAALWGWFRSTRGRCIAFALLSAAIAFLTPAVRAAAWPAGLPDPVEAYLRPIPGLTNFVLFPWAGFVVAGAIPGVLLAHAGLGEPERAMVRRITAGGAALAVTAFAASYLPSLPWRYAQSHFWTSSPAYFMLRAGLLTAAIGAAYVWERRPWERHRFSPLQQLGRTSLFVYWIHIEMIYGLAVRPLHHSLSFPAAALSIPPFAAFMLLCSIVKDRIVERSRALIHRDAR